PRLGNQELHGRLYHILCVRDDGGTGVEVEDHDDAAISALNYETASNGLTAVGDRLTLIYLGTHYDALKSVLT
ncbi:hypothetical protein ACI3PL_25390, partial [Lacticaseibacillus paracasei]